MNELVRDWKAEKKDLEEAFDIIADKLVKADAEIERLKADVEYWHHLATVENRALIVELCDALVYLEQTKIYQLPYHDNYPLIQRGRKATR